VVVSATVVVVVGPAVVVGASVVVSGTVVTGAAVVVVVSAAGLHDTRASPMRIAIAVVRICQR
jgi:hypothetical protein